MQSRSVTLTFFAAVTTQVVDKPRLFEGGIVAISNFGEHPDMLPAADPVHCWCCVSLLAAIQG